MGRRSRYIARRRSILKGERFQWDYTVTLQTWREYRREHWTDINNIARMVFNDSRRVEQPATTEPRSWGILNRATRRWMWKHRKDEVKRATPKRSRHV